MQVKITLSKFGDIQKQNSNSPSLSLLLQRWLEGEVRQISKASPINQALSHKNAPKHYLFFWYHRQMCFPDKTTWIKSVLRWIVHDSRDKSGFDDMLCVS